MNLHYQSRDGHTTLPDLSPAEVDRKFAELTRDGCRAFIETNLDRLAPHDFVTSPDEARRRGATDLYFTGRMKGG